MHGSTWPGADAALDVVQGELHQICRRMGVQPPDVRIVQSVGRGRAGDDTTADVRKLRTDACGCIRMPRRVVTDCPPDGLRWLLAHEMGHIADRNPRLTFLRRMFMVTAFALLLAALVAAVSAATGAAANGGELLVVLLVLAGLLAISGRSWVRRREEHSADRFAVSHLGSMQGAESYFAFIQAARGPAGRNRTGPLLKPVLWLMRTHPSTASRIAGMRQELRN